MSGQGAHVSLLHQVLGHQAVPGEAQGEAVEAVETPHRFEAQVPVVAPTRPAQAVRHSPEHDTRTRPFVPSDLAGNKATPRVFFPLTSRKTAKESTMRITRALARTIVPVLCTLFLVQAKAAGPSASLPKGLPADLWEILVPPGEPGHA